MIGLNTQCLWVTPTPIPGLHKYVIILTFIFSGHSDPKTVECKIYYKYAKKIYYESKEVKHCHDEPSVECENLMKMCHEEPEEVCGFKTEKGILLCWQKILPEIAIFLIRTTHMSNFPVS